MLRRSIYLVFPGNQKEFSNDIIDIFLPVHLSLEGLVDRGQPGRNCKLVGDVLPQIRDLGVDHGL